MFWYSHTTITHTCIVAQPHTHTHTHARTYTCMQHVISCSLSEISFFLSLQKKRFLPVSVLQLTFLESHFKSKQSYRTPSFCHAFGRLRKEVFVSATRGVVKHSCANYTAEPKRRSYIHNKASQSTAVIPNKQR